MKRLNCLFFVILFSLNLTLAQSPFDRYKVRQWTIKDGLPDNNLFEIIKTPDGFLWFTSYIGITRFDGVSFKVFSSKNVPEIKTDNFRGMTVTSDTTLWIATSNSGLLAYKKGRFQAFLEDQEFYDIIVQADGQLFCDSPLGREDVLFNPKTQASKVIPETEIWDKVARMEIIKANNRIDKDGYQWFIQRGQLKRAKNGKTKLLTTQDGLKEARVSSCFIDSQGRVWVTELNTLYLWENNQFRPIKGMEGYTYPGFNTATYRTYYYEDKSGGLWLTSTGGLHYLAPRADHFASLPDSHPLKNMPIKSITGDAEGNIWLTTEQGLFQMNRSNFINHTREPRVYEHRIAAVCALDTNRYLVASTEDLGQLFWVENGESRPYEIRNPKIPDYKNLYFQLYRDSQERIWVCGPNVTYYIDENGETIITRRKRVRYVHEDKTGKLWFAITNDGIFTFNEKTQALEAYEIPGLDFEGWSLSSVRKLRNGDLLITSFNKGVVRIDKDKKFKNYHERNGLTSPLVFDAREDEKGGIWLLSNVGLVYWKEDTFTKIDYQANLPNSSVFDFLEDQMGYVWLPSNIGLIRVKKQALYNYVEDSSTVITWKLYDQGDGMASRSCVGARHSTITSNGKILVPTFASLVEVDPIHLKKNTIPPPVTIHQVIWDNQAINLNQNKFIFDPGNHRFVFSFSGLSFVAPEKVQFKFRLIGYDKNWVESLGDRRAFYTNIPAGTYTFQVIASNNDGVWNEEGATFTFTIKPFFYETGWFRILTLLLFGLLIFAYVRLRTYNIQQKNKKLEAQVAERTIELKDANEELSQTNEELQSTIELVQKERKKSDVLLLNILPEETAAELKETGQATPKHYELVSVLFTDFKGFTSIAENLSPEEVIKELDTCFLAFDEICDRYKLEKIKTIGDSYMCAGGLPMTNKTNPIDAVNAALEIQAWMQSWKEDKEARGLEAWEIRMGIHSGPVVAGVVGKNKFAYDIWGDTVNLASRMESSGEPGKINISGKTYELVKDHFQCSYRGKVQAKNKGEVAMYFVEGLLVKAKLA